MIFGDAIKFFVVFFYSFSSSSDSTWALCLCLLLLPVKLVFNSHSNLGFISTETTTTTASKQQQQQLLKETNLCCWKEQKWLKIKITKIQNYSWKPFKRRQRQTDLQTDRHTVTNTITHTWKLSSVQAESKRGQQKKKLVVI